MVMLDYISFSFIGLHKDLDPLVMETPNKKYGWNTQSGCGKDTPNKEIWKLVPNSVIWSSLAGS